MRILFYNWVDYLDEEARGGGVSLYQRNVIKALSHWPEVSLSFLSAGISHDLMSRKPRWEKLRHGPDSPGIPRFEIVNSGVLSPGHHSFGQQAQTDHPETEAAFLDFLDQTGPYDIVHFNNLEGLPVSVLALKRRFPQTRVIYAMHNYYPICPQVNLWHQERVSCTDFGLGRKCETCLEHQYDARAIRLAHAVAYNLKIWGVRPGTRLFDRAFVPCLRLARGALRVWRRTQGRTTSAPLPGTDSARGPDAAQAGAVLRQLHLGSPVFQHRRQTFVERINTHCDLVLGVSERVCTLARHYGIRSDLLRTSYIGTCHADRFLQTSPRQEMLAADGTLTLAFLGYMRRDKGFFFLLDALEALPIDLARRIKLVLCARSSDTATMARVAALCDRFREVSHADGYTQSDLDHILATVDLGVIPVLWEDNLPQVAIEMHARRIPLLTSDLGGAHELSRCAALTFKAGDIADFHARLRAILHGGVTLDQYWSTAMAPRSNADHAAELLDLYHSLLAEAKMQRQGHA